MKRIICPRHQNKNSDAWKKLLDYVEEVAADGRPKFEPRSAIGRDYFKEIQVLPESIGKLKEVKVMDLYGSKLKYIPPQIGEMENLQDFDPYTSYQLHWFPYEITNCKKLVDSRISTRALYGNFKNRMPFPGLEDHRFEYGGDTVHCSICRQELPYAEIRQFWITLYVGTDYIPMLVNLCSDECREQLPHPQGDYLHYAHRGGPDLVQPERY
ncbi:hypothetical protein [Flavilitoribacter nigricans]|uniref:Leucine-rich repeat domain-containing protein n=1 Tax=Flavilitoribacter nigricans (strain ATCC 23147 / DSM 23189 / NBRC 102662 / NCIMB 1420 / SS-2) TaxID=1122177 RepID=A0A2D0NFT8_FLAN2|nr:hypothetical protein [Flavilitoribacter nigricans]PHN07364.1 hypothetical protein CRP01_06965 [Flavilitoribacter nigricans DSM 23189 = NBRC 102662]